MKKAQLYPQKALILCEKVDEANKRGNIIVPKDKEKNNFSVYSVIKAGDEVKEFYKKGDIIIVDEEHVNYILYEGDAYFFIDDGFVVAKVGKS